MEKLKYIIVAVLVFMVSFVGGCCGADATTAEADEPGLGDRFYFAERDTTWNYDFQLMVDRETGVMYLFVAGQHGSGGITVLLDAEGKPLVNKGE